MLGTIRLAVLVIIAVIAASDNAMAQKCQIDNRECVLEKIEALSAEIDREAWRDQTYRELAKTKAFDSDLDGALTVIDKIQNPDTKALTIRGIGMAVADLKWPKEQYDVAFEKLRVKAEQIEHPPSYAIALTYIAMAQAFAGDNEGAWATAADMENDALRHKAYGETAEIQAERGDFIAAKTSISRIDSLSFRNKAYAIVSKILADGGHLQQALDAAMLIENPYKQASALQYVLDTQKPREVKKQ
ncbi:MAG: hypothetical protein JKY71_05315 [Alphaproteobacteria bacterium]|nr:hypothetical protein [Alphaproteobacteria bacterium]